MLKNEKGEGGIKIQKLMTQTFIYKKFFFCLHRQQQQQQTERKKKKCPYILGHALLFFNLVSAER